MAFFVARVCQAWCLKLKSLVLRSSVVGSNSLLGWYLVSEKTVKSNCYRKDLLVPEEGEDIKEPQVDWGMLVPTAFLWFWYRSWEMVYILVISGRTADMQTFTDLSRPKAHTCLF